MNCLAMYIKTCEAGRKCFKNNCNILAIQSNNHGMLHQGLLLQNDCKHKIMISQSRSHQL